MSHQPIISVDLEECWLYAGSIDENGYGTITGNINGKSRSYGAHRFMYLATVGDVAKGLHLDHLCRVRCCINPKHLEPVTPRVNILRGVGASAINIQKTHCYMGHEFTNENIYYPPTGRRVCRKCRYLNQHVEQIIERAIQGKKARIQIQANNYIYALYGENQLLAVGTAEQLAKIFSIRPKTIIDLSTNGYRRKRKSTGKSRYAIRLGKGI